MSVAISFLFIILATLGLSVGGLGGTYAPRNFYIVSLWAALLSSILLFKPYLLAFKKNDRHLWAVPFFILLAIVIHAIAVPVSQRENIYVINLFLLLSAFFLSFKLLPDMQIKASVWFYLAIFAGALLSINALLTLIIPFYIDSQAGHIFKNITANFGGFGQRNMMASFAATVSLWLWVLYLPKSKDARYQASFVFLIQLIINLAVVLSGSKAGLLGLIIGALIVLIYGVKSVKSIHAATPVFILLLSVLLAQINPQEKITATDRLSKVTVGATAEGVRLSIWQRSLEAGMEKPFIGHGVGSFSRAYYNTYEKTPRRTSSDDIEGLGHPHNELMIWWVETGLYGLLLIVAPLVVWYLWFIWRFSKYPGFVLAAVSPIMIHSMTELPLQSSMLHVILLSIIPISLLTKKNDLGLTVSRISKGSVVAVIPMIFSIYLFTIGISIQSWADAYKRGNVAAYIEELGSNFAYQSWMLRSHMMDYVDHHLLQIAVAAKDYELIRQLIPSVEEIQARYHRYDLWMGLARAYKSIDDMEGYERQIAIISKINPEKGSQIRHMLE